MIQRKPFDWDIYRFQLERASEKTGLAARPSPRMRPATLDDRCREADAALDRALAEFKAAATAVIDRIREGESLPKPELDREWSARVELVEARKRVERLSQLKKAPPKKSA